MFEIPALLPTKSPLAVHLLTSWPSLGMYIFQGYTIKGVTCSLFIRLLACALGTDSGLFVTMSLTVQSSHNNDLSFKFQGPSNKQFKNHYWKNLSKRVKIHFWKIFEEIFLWFLNFLETQLYCWNLKNLQVFQNVFL